VIYLQTYLKDLADDYLPTLRLKIRVMILRVTARSQMINLMILKPSCLRKILWRKKEYVKKSTPLSTSRQKPKRFFNTSGSHKNSLFALKRRSLSSSFSNPKKRFRASNQDLKKQIERDHLFIPLRFRHQIKELTTDSVDFGESLLPPKKGLFSIKTKMSNGFASCSIDNRKSWKRSTKKQNQQHDGTLVDFKQKPFQLEALLGVKVTEITLDNFIKTSEKDAPVLLDRKLECIEKKEEIP